MYFSRSCKCLRVVLDGDESTAIVSDAVTNLAVPAFLAIVVKENNGNVDITLSFQGMAKSG